MKSSRTSRNTPSPEKPKTGSKAETARAQRLLESARILCRVHRALPVLSSIRWPLEVRERFFAREGRALPRVRYKPFDAAPLLEELAEARKLAAGTDATELWLRRTVRCLRTTANMLAAAGSPVFSRRAQTLYGRPTDCFPGTQTSPLDLARRLIRTARRVNPRLPEPPEPTLGANEAAEEIRAAVNAHFGDRAPAVEVVAGLTARASAAPRRIRLRETAMFSDLDIRQLIQHEAFVHVATSINGRRQRKMPLLAANHPGTTRTQEGLAVFAELISGALDPTRFLRLAHRVIAIQMALDGADFLEVYAYFLEHSHNRIEAFESTARVFRGGLVAGGSPFTKDMVYLDGLCRVHVFIRAAIDTGRVDCLRLLFTGKLDLGDVDAILELERLGLTRGPRFVPPWVRDPRRLVAYFAVTDVIGHAAFGGLRRHYVEHMGTLRPLRKNNAPKDKAPRSNGR